MMTDLERLAGVLYRMPADNLDDRKTAIRAILKELREPSQSTIDAVFSSSYVRGEDFVPAWQAAIDAILEEE